MRLTKVVGVASAVMLCLSAVAVADNQSRQETLDQLEQLLEAQKSRITELNQHVASIQDSHETARTEALKQQIREVLGEQEFRDSLMPTMMQAGYDRGFFIKSSDDMFKMKFNVAMQFRWTHYNVGKSNRYLNPRQQRNDRTGFDLSILYLDFSGHAYTPDLTYLVTIDGSEYRANTFGVLHAWVNYRFADAFQFTAGLMRCSGTRANLIPVTMQFVGPPMVEEYMAVSRGLGVRFWGQLFKGNPIHGEYSLDIVNRFNEAGQNTLTNDAQILARGNDNNPAIIFRTVWALMGEECEHPAEGVPYLYPSCDLAFHTSPFATVGFHYLYTEDDHDGAMPIAVSNRSPLTPGGFGLVPSDGMQIHQWGLDATFMYRGFSFATEYAMRLLDVRNGSRPPFSSVFLATNDGDNSCQHMWYAQAGYFLPIPGWERKFEIVARAGMLHIDTGGRETTWEYTGGFNYYIQGHQMKLQFDVTKIIEAPFTGLSYYSLANVNDDPLIFRMQFQLLF